MKKILLLLMCLACVAAQASDHELSEGEDQDSYYLEGSPDAVGQASDTLAGDLLEAINDSHEISRTQRLRSKSCGDLDALCKAGFKVTFPGSVLSGGKQDGFVDLLKGSSGSSSDDEQGECGDFAAVRDGSEFGKVTSKFIGQMSLRELATAATTVASDALATTYQFTGQIHKVLIGSRKRLPVSISEQAVISPLAREFVKMILSGDEKRILALLHAGTVGTKDALIRLNNDGFAPFHQALRLPKEKRETVIAAMWACNKQVLNTHCGDGKLVLNNAFMSKEHDEVKFLITYGADPEHPDKSGQKACGLLVKYLSDQKLTNPSFDISSDPFVIAFHQGREKNLQFTLEKKVGQQLAKQLEKSKGKK